MTLDGNDSCTVFTCSNACNHLQLCAYRASLQFCAACAPVVVLQKRRRSAQMVWFTPDSLLRVTNFIAEARLQPRTHAHTHTHTHTVLLLLLHLIPAIDSTSHARARAYVSARAHHINSRTQQAKHTIPFINIHTGCHCVATAPLLISHLSLS